MATIGPEWVYVLSNKTHSHLLKIGRSEDDPERRAAALNSTGVPHPFVVEFKIMYRSATVLKVLFINCYVNTVSIPGENSLKFHSIRQRNVLCVRLLSKKTPKRHYLHTSGKKKTFRKFWWQNFMNLTLEIFYSNVQNVEPSCAYQPRG